ncbi:hypothetical protein H2198_005276 [Neophaeococcomyces mojaviensis]|uniref:Uncharacterized protein n=1 Tax=Neophaeococcomyces mojaviensis TaxID=3383035 RepID=A0ACC3A5Z3_9EURO|nr:hypothetical protein H2198_005276 [Knufia sp. JES_112]
MLSTGSRLLDLPSEIRLQIWELAFGHTDFALYGTAETWDECQECSVRGPLRCSPQASVEDRSGRYADKHAPMKEYNDKLSVLLIHRTVVSEALPIFLSMLTLHCDHLEILRMLSKIGPASLKNNVTKLILHVHYNSYNLYGSLVEMSELTKNFPKLKHLRINYHMRPPISYQNLFDAMYLTVPILILPPPLNRPFLVQRDELLPPDEHHAQMKVDDRPGTTVYTAYMKQEPLFEALFLGEVTTEDAIDEHTAVIRALFHDPEYIAAAKQVVTEEGTIRDPAGVDEIEQRLLRIARAYERNWSAKLHRRRMIQFYTSRGQSKEDAEAYLDRQLADLPEGEGIEVLIQNMMQEEVSLQEFIA